MDADLMPAGSWPSLGYVVEGPPLAVPLVGGGTEWAEGAHRVRVVLAWSTVTVAIVSPPVVVRFALTPMPLGFPAATGRAWGWEARWLGSACWSRWPPGLVLVPA